MAGLPCYGVLVALGDVLGDVLGTAVASALGEGPGSRRTCSDLLVDLGTGRAYLQ